MGSPLSKGSRVRSPTGRRGKQSLSASPSATPVKSGLAVDVPARGAPVNGPLLIDELVVPDQAKQQPAEQEADGADAANEASPSAPGGGRSRKKERREGHKKDKKGKKGSSSGGAAGGSSGRARPSLLVRRSQQMGAAEQPLHTDDTAAAQAKKEDESVRVVLVPIEEPDEPPEEEDEADELDSDDFIGDGLALEGGDEREAARHGSGAEQVQYLSSELEILHEQARAVREIAEVLSLPPATATLLLRHHRWNKDRLLQRYMEDPAKTCKEAGAAPASAPAPAPAASSPAPGRAAPASSCTICCDATDASTSSALSCGHTFCNACWAEYLQVKIAEGEISICCPALKCNVHADEATVRRLVPAATFERYLRFLTKEYVEAHPTVRWCPAPGCGHAINALDASRGAITCRCGYRFCFSCNQEAHAPASCEQVREWQKKCMDDSETTHWIYANTLDCPKCKCNIEKNGGCNHMVCRQCKYEFCWVCRKDWKGHNDYYSCNRFKKAADQQKASDGAGGSSLKKRKGKESAKEREAREKEASRQALDKYLHYYHRYMNHDRSRQFETQLREEANRKMRQMQATDATWVGVQFIARAAEQLIVCRSMLKYSYVYAYYLPDGAPAKHLFEYLQKDLEQTTEELSGAVSAPAESIQRVHVMNLTKVAERMAAALEDAVEQAALAPPPAPTQAGSSAR